ncbi:MAG: acyl--CoA ligase [Phycisphaerales bacterium]|nr:MAG: acyl--CoA ligase [Phycisphaerales bacterium]
MGLDPTLLDQWLSRSAGRYPTKEAIVCGSDRWPYRKLNACANRLAESLVDLGVARQDRVAVSLGNCPETIVSLFGTLRAGATCVPLEGSTKARRLRYVLEDSGARVLIARGNQAEILAEALESWEKELTIIWVGPSPRVRLAGGISSVTWESVFARLQETDEHEYDVACDKFPRRIDLDLAAIIYTSATTGRAKGVMCTHYNMIAAARSIIQYLGNDERDIILDVLPLSFGYGLYQVLVSCMVGATVVIERSFLYPHLTLSRLAQENVTGFPLVPSIAAMLLRMENIGDYDFSTLRYITNAGAALPVGHLRRLRRLVPQAELFNMYGLTECVRVCYLSGAELDERPASVGHPMPNCEVRIVDEAGNTVAPGEPGELTIRGSNVMQGYWNDPEMSARTYHAGQYPVSRWLHSGDFFRTDEAGYLYFLGRRDDMIKTRGERVSPKEIEDVVCELESIVEAAAIGVPDDILGQAVKVFVVDGQGTLSEKDIMRHCAKRLEPLMVPKYLEFVEALPKTGRGKINRRELQTAKGE